jgi:hypothetical protein
MIFCFAQKDSSEAVDAALELLRPKVRRDWNFCDDIREIKREQTSNLDSMLVKKLRCTEGDVLDALKYRKLFQTIFERPTIDTPMKQYADRTLKAIEGEEHRRQAQFQSHSRT